MTVCWMPSGRRPRRACPCLTGVKPSFAEPFLDYAGGYSQWVEPDEAALERWWAGRDKG